MALADDHPTRRADLGPPGELPSLAQFAERLTVGPRRASAGATAALAVALAADLVGQVAERSTRWLERFGALAQVDAVRDRALTAAPDVAQAYHVLLAALDRAVIAPGGSGESARLGRELERAADLLMEIAETACDCAALAVTVAKAGDTTVAADATAAAILAAAGAEMAAHLVDVNLLASNLPERAGRTRQLAALACGYRSAALEIVR